MKHLTFLPIIYLSLSSVFGQVDSIAFKRSANVEVKTSNVNKIKINNVEVFTNGENSEYLSINSTCNHVVPTYSQLTGPGTFIFKRIKSDVQASLAALGSSLSYEKKSEFFVFYFTRSKSYRCPENSENIVNYGVGVYIIFKVSGLKVDIKIRTPYDISAASHLGLAKVELDVRTYGMTPALQNEFIPESVSDIDIKAVMYFDKVVTSARTLVNDTNTEPNILPVAW